MPNLLELKKGDFIGYVSVEKPKPISTDGPLHWLIAITEPAREAATVCRLEDIGLRPYLPVLHKTIPAGRRRKREIERPMFVSRIFVPMPLDLEAWDRVRAVRGLRDFMRSSGGNRPAVLPDIVIEEIRRMEAKLDVKHRRKLAVQVETPYRRGRQVWAEILPLRKMLGRIEETNAMGNIEVLLEVEVFGRRVWPVPPHLLQFVEL